MAIIMIYYINKKHNIYYNKLSRRYLVVRDGKILGLKGQISFDNIKALYEKLESSKSYLWENLTSYSASRTLIKEFNNWEEVKSFPETHPEYFI